jgi:23S rRNA (pseudouridine1915-N3)-methyltransferase
MKITLIAVGRMRDKRWKKLAREYENRIEHYRPLDVVEVRESTDRDPSRRQVDEGAAILDAVPRGAVLVVMDETGEETTSPDFAAWIDRRMVRGTRHLAFAIGGPEGLSDAVRAAADRTLALSRMTLPHEMARVVLAEQIYRAMTIIRGEPYHR